MHAQLDYTCTTMFIILNNLVIRNLPPNIAVLSAMSISDIFYDKWQVTSDILYWYINENAV